MFKVKVFEFLERIRIIKLNVLHTHGVADAIEHIEEKISDEKKPSFFNRWIVRPKIDVPTEKVFPKYVHLGSKRT